MPDVPPALYRLSVEGEPQVKQRPRVVNGHTYTPAATVQAEHRLAWAFKGQYPGVEPDALTRFGLRVIFFVKSARRADIDNRLKVILDAGNGVIWQDDSQCDEIHALVIHGVTLPRTQIEIFRVRPEWG
jgi:Holliday junction resolvase RusA-like endonuclease